MSDTIKVGDVRGVHTIGGPEGASMVTMSHSFSTNHTVWDHQLSALTEFYRVLRCDKCGYGCTDTLERVSTYSTNLWTGHSQSLSKWKRS